MNHDYLEYTLPADLIAQSPASPRDHSRLLCINRCDGSLEDRFFYEIDQVLPDNCSLVFNDTRVIHARLYGQRKTGGKVECFLVKPLSQNCWEALLKPAKRLKTGETIEISPHFHVKIIKKGADKLHLVELICDQPVMDMIQENGQIPLPPYIQNQAVTDSNYQTIFAKTPGAVAAPTAGLHFTPAIIEKLHQKGIRIHTITLHVGYGTFEPIRSLSLSDHKIHEERFYISEQTATNLAADKREGRPIFAVGTTVTRALESAFKDGHFQTDWQVSELFIYPGYSFQCINGLITNFHLPYSTLLCLVSAFSSIETIKIAYEHAIKERYRFYSFGDAMILH